ncbi:sentrin-specific protease 2-like [Daktulosphaira vitifoliae]|uniref:sentrin-specific protease 2-like n=1 Tax=Daktulosphaira vitifoliae TaxID=58002 RepID=UPI0021A9FE87|nr:sentrin-specific protease 2-like [Daktulosphaira vitifoliae]
MESFEKWTKNLLRSPIQPLGDTPPHIETLDDLWVNGEVDWSKYEKSVNLKASKLFIGPTKTDTNWYNDIKINKYFRLIKNTYKNISILDTFFYQAIATGADERIRRWTKNINIFRAGKVLIPIHSINHWKLIVIEPATTSITLYDSFNEPDDICLSSLHQYTQQEYTKSMGSTLPFTWTVRLVCSPSQLNGYDCGVFTCETAKRIASGLPLNYTQQDIPAIRKRIDWEINKNILKREKTTKCRRARKSKEQELCESRGLKNGKLTKLILVQKLINNC